MGTHPIFESDFDCLTEMKSVSNEIGNGNKRHFRVPTGVDQSKSVSRERRACTQRNAVPKDDFHRVWVKRDGKINLGFLVQAQIEKNCDYRHERYLVYLDGGEMDWFELQDIANVNEIFPDKGLEAAYDNETISLDRKKFNHTQMKCLEARRRINDQDYDFIKPDLSVGQVLLFDENIPVQVTGVTDIGGLNIRVRNLIEGWTCWVPFFSINFLQNRQCYQEISDERSLFKDFKIMRSQNCLELRPKIVMPTKIHPSLLGDWNPLNHQLNLIDQVQPLEKEAIEIISECGEKRVCTNDDETTAKMSKISIEDEDGSSGIGSNDSNHSHKHSNLSDNDSEM